MQRLGRMLQLLPLAALVSLAGAFCPLRCQCDDNVPMANCTGARLESFPISLNPRLKRLLLAHNAIRRVDTSMVSSYSELEFLDFSSNGMLSVQAGSFASQAELQELRLGQNELAQLEPGTFRGLETLRELDLGGNLLAALPDNLFQGTPLLQNLNLAGNVITVLSPQALAGAVGLSRLDLANNRLSRVPAEALSSLRRLDWLSLAGNDLTRLEPGELARAAPALVDLSLAGNRLAPLAGGAFVGLSALRRLQLADTALSAADADTFAGLQRLEQLHLGGNPLSRLGAAPLRPLHRLQLLSVRACPALNTLEADTFAHSPALAAVYLEENPSLTELPAGLFLRLPLLRRLGLRANALTSLSADVADWRRLHARLEGNPWRCDCALRWLAALPAAANASGATCAEPLSMRGLVVRSLTAADLQCESADSGSVALVAGVGAAVSLLVLLVAVALCHRYRRRLHKMFKVMPCRDIRCKEPYQHGTTYYCHDMYDPINPSTSKPVPVTEL